jgi:hypothetical protein
MTPHQVLRAAEQVRCTVEGHSWERGVEYGVSPKYVTWHCRCGESRDTHANAEKPSSRD